MKANDKNYESEMKIYNDELPGELALGYRPLNRFVMDHTQRMCEDHPRHRPISTIRPKMTVLRWEALENFSDLYQLKEHADILH